MPKRVDGLDTSLGATAGWLPGASAVSVVATSPATALLTYLFDLDDGMAASAMATELESDEALGAIFPLFSPQACCEDIGLPGVSERLAPRSS